MKVNFHGVEKITLVDRVELDIEGRISYSITIEVKDDDSNLSHVLTFFANTREALFLIDEA